MRTWLKRNRFPLLLALGLVVMEILVALLLLNAAGPDRRWLGDTIQNPSDQAVYLSYIEQIRQDANGLKNLYAPEPQTPFWIPFYVFIGLVARLTGWSGLLTNEVVRWLSTIVSLLILHVVSRRLTKNENDANWATALIAVGGGAGWIIGVWNSIHHIIQIPFVVPDVAAETFFFPKLLAGAHIPISFALLAFSLEWLWYDATHEKRRPGVVGYFATVLLFAIHPYFAPIFAFFGLIAVLYERRHFFVAARRISVFAIAACVGIAPSALAYLLNPTRRFILDQNVLPLGSWWEWVAAFAPWIAALIWRIQRRVRLDEREQWLVAWILSACLALFLPFQWKRKLTEGLGAAAVWLALPAILVAREWLRKQSRFILFSAFVALCFSPLQVLMSQVAWAGGGFGRGDELFLSKNIFSAWSFIKRETPHDAIVLSDTVNVGLWTPPYALRHVWVGHDMETPDWKTKVIEQKIIFQTGSTDEAKRLIESTGANLILTTTASSTERISNLSEETTWRSVATFDEVTVWEK